MDLVSVVMLVYNHEEFIAQAINGVINQDYNNLEIIILDDRSTDNSFETAKKICENHWRRVNISIIRHDRNIGMIQNLNFGLRCAKGKYLAICEGDDFWSDSKKISRQVEEFKNNPDVSIIYHRVNILYEKRTEFETLNTSVVEEKFNLNELSKGNKIHTCSVMYKNANITLENKYFNSPVGDYILHLKYAQIGDIIYLPDIMATYRHGVGIWTRQKEIERYKKWKTVLQLLLTDASFDDETKCQFKNQIKFTNRRIRLSNAFWKIYYRILDGLIFRFNKIGIK